MNMFDRLSISAANHVDHVRNGMRLGPSDPSGKANAVFISYRRDDQGAFAGRLYDRLEPRFGKNQVFMDVDSIALK